MPGRSLVIGPVLFAVLLTTASAQAHRDKWEIGGQLTFVDQNPLDKFNDYGFGARISYSPFRFLAAEGELTYYPRNLDTPSEPRYVLTPYRLEALFGVKSGFQLKRFGIFGKFRPGLMKYGASPEELFFLAWSPPSLDEHTFTGKTHFVLDAGGVLEVYPSKKTLIRFDVSDLLVRFPPARYNSEIFLESFNIHNLRLGLGFGFRF